MSRFLHSRFGGLEAYVPGEQPTDRRYIKLNTNESPFPPPPAVAAALNEGEAADLRLYSDPCGKKLKAALAERYSQQLRLRPENVYLANGSDDILNFAFLAFGEQGVVYPAISYGFYPVYAALHGLKAEEIPLEADLSIDPRRYWGKNRLIVMANPNAPTGLLLRPAEIEGILAANRKSVVLIDEAYIDFGGESCLPLIGRYDNLLVVRTFSKSRSLAGARLGFALAAPALIADLEKLQYSTNPYHVNRLTQIAGLASLGEDDYNMRNCRLIQENREEAAAALKALGFSLTDSKTNFLFARSDRIGGAALYARLREKGILIRHFGKPERIADYVRITVGSREEMQALIRAIQEILEECP